MYWLNGVPRVYAVNGPSIPLTSSNGREAPTNEFSEDEGIQNEKPAVVLEDQKPPAAWAEEVIKGLCNSRNGQLFATMTESSISVWQTKVYPIIMVSGNLR
jgi:hypothetical protein